MGFALVSLMGYFLFPTLIIYVVGVMLLGGRSLTLASKVVGFGLALFCAAVAGLIFAPIPSIVSAKGMFWQGSAAGAVIGVALILGIGRRKASEQSSARAPSAESPRGVDAGTSSSTQPQDPSPPSPEPPPVPEEEMARLGIEKDGEQFRYQSYRYDRLEDAISYARLDRSRAPKLRC